MKMENSEIVNSERIRSKNKKVHYLALKAGASVTKPTQLCFSKTKVTSACRAVRKKSGSRVRNHGLQSARSYYDTRELKKEKNKRTAFPQMTENVNAGCNQTESARRVHPPLHRKR